MGFEFSWLLLALPFAFVLGWLASRLDWRQMRILQRSAPKTYYRGLTYLLNEQQDKAIDVFVQAVQNDPDTIELHFALGNLFRRRGEYDRAIRVHEHLLARADLHPHDRDRAQYDLAQDFMKAGLYDRAETALKKLAGTSLENDGLIALLFIYERAQDWKLATEVTRQMEKNAQGDFSGRRCHYLCEQAVHARESQQYEQAAQLLEAARKEASSSIRPHIETIELWLRQDRPETAWQAILALEARDTAPAALALVAHHLSTLAQAQGHEHLVQAQAFLQRQYERQPSLDILVALVDVETALQNPQAAQWYLLRQLQAPSLVAAARWMGQTAQLPATDRPALQQALQRAQEPLMRYRCAACGFETRRYFWQCPGCQSWESYPPQRIEEL